MKNKFEVRGNKVAIFLHRKDGSVLETIIDKADLWIPQGFNGSWFAWWDKKNKSFYVRGNLFENGKWKTIHLHRLLMDCPDDLVVDHKNHNTLRNIRDNLRNVTRGGNSQNQVDHENKSGHRGVDRIERLGKWRSTAWVNGKQIYLGLFDDITQAATIAHQARVKLMPCYIHRPREGRNS